MRATGKRNASNVKERPVWLEGTLFEVVWLKFLEGIDSLTYVMQLFWHFVRAAELERLAHDAHAGLVDATSWELS